MNDLDWTDKLPTEPGIYWFASKFPSVYGEKGMEMRELMRDHEGQLFAKGYLGDLGWGPEPGYLKATQPGFWAKITRPDHPMGYKTSKRQ